MCKLHEALAFGKGKGNLMEMSSSECMALDVACKVLAKSRAVQSLVRKAVGTEKFLEAPRSSDADEGRKAQRGSRRRHS